MGLEADYRWRGMNYSAKNVVQIFNFALTGSGVRVFPLPCLGSPEKYMLLQLLLWQTYKVPSFQRDKTRCVRLTQVQQKRWQQQNAISTFSTANAARRDKLYIFTNQQKGPKKWFKNVTWPLLWRKQPWLWGVTVILLLNNTANVRPFFCWIMWHHTDVHFSMIYIGFLANQIPRRTLGGALLSRINVHCSATTYSNICINITGNQSQNPNWLQLANHANAFKC